MQLQLGLVLAALWARATLPSDLEETFQSQLYMYFFLYSHIIWAAMCEYATATVPCACYDIFNWKLYFLKSARSRNSDYSESRGTNPLWDFALIWSCTEKYGFLDMGDFGGVESSVESVISWSNFAVRSKGNSQKSAHIDGCYSEFGSELTPEIFCLVMCLLNACNFVHRSAGNSHRRQQYFLVYFCFLLHELFWELADFGEILPEMQTALAVGDIFIGLLYRNTGLFWENIWLLWKKPKKKYICCRQQCMAEILKYRLYVCVSHFAQYISQQADFWAWMPRSCRWKSVSWVIPHKYWALLQEFRPLLWKYRAILKKSTCVL